MKRLIRRYLFQASLRRGSTVMGGPHRRTAHRARRRRRNMNDMGVDHVHHPVVHPDSLTPPRQPRFGTDFDDLMINSQMSHKRETSDTNKPRASPHDQRQQSNGEHQRIHLAIGARRAYARKRHDNIPNEIIEHKLLKETISVAIVLDDGSKDRKSTRLN